MADKYFSKNSYINDKDELVNELTQKKSALKGKPAELFRFFLDHPRRIYSKDDLLDALWPEGGGSYEGIYVHLNAIKSALKKIDEEKVVASRYGQGYYYAPSEELLTKKRYVPYQERETRQDLLPQNLPSILRRDWKERDELVNQICNSFEQGYEVLFLYGQPGIGKTELAIVAGKEYSKNHPVARIIYEENLYSTLMKLDIRVSGRSEEEIFMNKLHYLETAYKDGLLIIDNFYDPERSLSEMRQDETYTQLISCGIKLLFTTRYANTQDDMTFKEVPPLSRKQQLALLKEKIRNCPYEDGELEPLCEAVGGNTLLVDLLGRLLADPLTQLTPAELLKILKENRLASLDLPVSMVKDGRYQEETVYSHLKTLLGKYEFSKEERKVLRILPFIPSSGMDVGLFLTLSGTKTLLLRSLRQRGLLDTSSESVITLHPLFVRYYFDPENSQRILGESIEEFEKSLCAYYNSGKPRSNRICRQMADTLKEVYRKEEDPDRKADLAINIGCHEGLLGNYLTAYEYEKKAIAELEEKGGDERLLAALYRNAGISAGRFDEAERSLEYIQKAAGYFVREGVTSEYLKTLNSLAYAYGRTGDYHKEKELRLQSTELAADFPENRARSLDGLANAEHHLGEEKAALQHIGEALTIYETLDNCPVVWSVQAMRLQANILSCLGKTAGAEEALKKALDLLNSEANGHPETIRILTALGDLAQGEKAAKIYKEACLLALRLKQTSFQHCRKEGENYILWRKSEGGTLFLWKMDEEEYRKHPFLLDGEAVPQHCARIISVE